MRTAAWVGMSCAMVMAIAAACGGASSETVEPTPTPVTTDDPDIGDSTGTREKQTEPDGALSQPDPTTVMASSANLDVLGIWKGTEVGRADVPWTFQITSDKMIVTAGKMEVYEGTYALELESRPMRIIATITASNMKQYVGKSSNAIFELRGDSLTLAANEPGDSAFPADFGTSGDARVFELTRQR